MCSWRSKQNILYCVNYSTPSCIKTEFLSHRIESLDWIIICRETGMVSFRLVTANVRKRLDRKFFTGKTARRWEIMDSVARERVINGSAGAFKI